ncbi:integrator complex subunit 13-like [Ptychodera flava]|uniref:integrator complex subunit 13-like n=1 Tax=Ptychodera flava TaxID=63121 RepID=UPI003969D538
MTFPIDHKTVFVLDHSPEFAESCKHNVDFDIFTKSRGTTGVIPLAPIAKSLWTCAVEATLEYCRIVYDIFPSGKLIRFIASDTEAHILNSWQTDEQGLSHITQSFARLGPPSETDDSSECSVMHGLASAVEVLCECTEKQHEVRTSMTEESSRIKNRGRIVCITSVKSDSHVKMLEEWVLDAISQHNKLAAGSDSLMPINYCEFYLIHTMPLGMDAPITEDKHNVSSVLGSVITVSRSGRYLAQKLAQIVQVHFDLSSTTITGIPMKEEQNASSSANYDVELLHHRSAHFDKLSGAPSTSDGVSGLTLKWCTPRSNTIELQHCIGACRVTPVDVISRPSSCLTNFLLNGRQVMLEQPRKTGAKVISHMLTSHGGEIYIHCLAINRSTLEDPPSISEGCGGRVTDYRITDFGEFMKENRVAPKEPTMEETEERPLHRMKAQLERQTRHWPMVISHTIVFNMLSHVDPLPSLVTKEHLDEDDVLECKKSIYHLVGMESRSEALPVPVMGTRGKGPKREEQYRQMWSELETLVRSCSDLSPAHEQVLECLLECRKPSEENPKTSKRKAAMEVKEEVVEKVPVSETEQAWQALDNYKGMSEREKRDFNLGDTNNDHMKYDSPLSPEPPVKKQKALTGDKQKGGGPKSFLALWNNKLSSIYSKKHVEFAGRLATSGSMGELYPHLNSDGESSPVNGNGKA